ncbi:MAG: heavy metal-associated domain-containing protein [Planctomycetota bacterium]|nr:heavy metal-associated domain-containing protein [Planctomycetota bacterium]
MRNWSIACAVFCLCCAAFSGCSSREPKASPEKSSSAEAAGEQLVFTVRGMHCDGCAKAITEAVQAVPGVQSVEVSFEDKRAVIVPTKDGFDQEAALAVIKKMGYEATPAARADGVAEGQSAAVSVPGLSLWVRGCRAVLAIVLLPDEHPEAGLGQGPPRHAARVCGGGCQP